MTIRILGRTDWYTGVKALRTFAAYTFSAEAQYCSSEDRNIEKKKFIGASF